MNMKRNTWDRLLSLAHEAAAPESLLRLRRGAVDVDSDDFEVKPGQIWSAEWAGEVMCVLTLDAGSPSRCLQVAPVSLEPEARNRFGTVLDATDTTLGVPVTIWSDLVRELPLKTLDHPLGSVANDILESVRSQARRLHRESVRPARRPDTEDFLSSSLETRLRAEIQDSLATLESALKTTEDAVTIEVDTLSPQIPLHFKDVMQALGVGQQQAMAIVRGKHPLSFEEANLLAEATGRRMDEIRSITAPLPEEATIELDQPRWRGLIRDESSRHHVDEDTARVSLGYEAFGLAARQQGGGRDVWRQRFRTIARGRHEHDSEGS